MKQDKAILVLKIIYFICICLFPILILLTILLKWPLRITFIYVGVVIILYLVVHIIHAKNYQYICPKCNKRFRISVFKDITAYNAKPGAKVLVCPNCGVKEVMNSENIDRKSLK